MIKSVRMCDFTSAAMPDPPGGFGAPAGYPAAGFGFPGPPPPQPAPLPAGVKPPGGRLSPIHSAAFPGPPAAFPGPPPAPQPPPTVECAMPAAGTCPICARDACAHHFGDNYLRAAVFIGPAPSLFPGGPTGVQIAQRSLERICSACAAEAQQAGAYTTMAVGSLLEPFAASPIAQTIQAAIAEYKLTRSDPD